MNYRKIRVVFGVTMPDGQYNNDKTVTYSVPMDVEMKENSDYANRWRALVNSDMKSYCRLIGATPVAIMAGRVYYKDYQRGIVY